MMDDKNSIDIQNELRSRLILAENQLVLMKKLRQSATRQPPKPQPTTNGTSNPANTLPAANNRSSAQQNAANNIQINQQSLSNNGKFNLNQFNQANALNHTNMGRKLNSLINPRLGLHPSTSAHSGSTSTSPSVNQGPAPAHAHQHQKLNNSWSTQDFNRQPPPKAAGITPIHVGNLSRTPITTPPNAILRLNSSSTSSNNSAKQQRISQPNQQLQHLQNQQKPQKQQHLQQQQQQLDKIKTSQMLQQKRMANKTAVQKMVEQTLVQGQPKQTNSVIDFIPNPNNSEFVYCIGLETCVDYLTNTNNDVQPAPYECTSCGTDFSPRWSKKRANVVCENCLNSQTKKSIKSQQAIKIKSTLSKAIKQEQEMNKKITIEPTNSALSSPINTSANLINVSSLLNNQIQSNANSVNNNRKPQNKLPMAPVNTNNNVNSAQLLQQIQRLQPFLTGVNNDRATLQPASFQAPVANPLLNPINAFASLLAGNAGNTDQLTSLASILLSGMNQQQRRPA